MKHSVWAGPWDCTPEFAAETGGLDVRMAYAYHAGRWYLPRHPQHRVYELPRSAVYFDADVGRFDRLKPSVATTRVHLGRPHAAWLVLCHNDTLGTEHPDCCVRNRYGDVYSYALCPANPDVQSYVVELCRQAAAQPGVTALDLESLSFFGFEHGGLHEKRGVTLSCTEIEQLSVCCCRFCEPHRDHVLEWRREVLFRLLGEIRRAVPSCKLNLRVAPDASFVGGKFPCAMEHLSSLDGLVDAITLTFFGTSTERMRQTLLYLPVLPFPVHAGYVVHEPDCRNDSHREERYRIVESSQIAETAFYCWSLAGQDAIQWIKRKERPI